MAKDPICGMFVEETKAPVRQEIDGTEYFFCSKNCLNEFIAPKKELANLKKLVIIGVALTVPIALLTWISILPE